MAGPSSYMDTTGAEVVDADAEVVILGDAADLDNQLFSDGDVTGVELSWPEVEAIVSNLSIDDMLALCNSYSVPDAYRAVCAGHLRRASTTPAAGSGAVCVYAAALDAGMRFPLHGFYVKLLRHYRLAPSQLTPNSWAYMAAFVRLCEDAGVEPLVSVFRHFFAISVHKDKRSQLPSGWHHILPFPQGARHRCWRRLFTGGNLLSNWSGWMSRYFFLQAGKSWKCPVKWGKPRRADVLPPQDAVHAAIVKMEGEVIVAAAGTGSSASASACASTGNKRKSPEEPVTPQHDAASRPTPPALTATPTGPTLPGFSPTLFGAQGSYSALHVRNTIVAGERDMTQLQNALRAANGEVAKLRRELQEVKEEHAAEYARHMTATAAQLTRLEEEFNQEHAAHVQRLKDTAAKEVRDAVLKAKKDAVLAILPSLEHMPLKFAKLD